MIFATEGTPLLPAHPLYLTVNGVKGYVVCPDCKVAVSARLIRIDAPHAVMGSCPHCGRKVRQTDTLNPEEPCHD